MLDVSLLASTNQLPLYHASWPISSAQPSRAATGHKTNWILIITAAWAYRQSRGSDDTVIEANYRLLTQLDLAMFPAEAEKSAVAVALFHALEHTLCHTHSERHTTFDLWKIHVCQTGRLHH